MKKWEFERKQRAIFIVSAVFPIIATIVDLSNLFQTGYCHSGLLLIFIKAINFWLLTHIFTSSLMVFFEKKYADFLKKKNNEVELVIFMLLSAACAILLGMYVSNYENNYYKIWGIISTFVLIIVFYANSKAIKTYYQSLHYKLPC